MATIEITKHNVCEVIDAHLKEQKIRYAISDQDSKGCLYELYISSVESFIQVEYNLDDESDPYITVQFFTDVDTNGNSIYHSDWDNWNTERQDSIEGEIDQLVEYVKRISQGVAKINSKIEQIKDICEEYGLEFEEFIDVLYDFD